jgi:hypothetical protein
MTDFIDDMFKPGSIPPWSKARTRRATALQKAEDKQAAKIKKAEEKFVAAWEHLQGTAGKGKAERFLYEATGLKSARRLSKDGGINQSIRFYFELARDFGILRKRSVEEVADAISRRAPIKGSRVALLKRIERIREEMINASELPSDFKKTYYRD